MTNRLELNWSLDGFVDEQRYYCSETPIDPENSPEPKAILDGSHRSYVDSDGISAGRKRFIAISSIKNIEEKFSEVNTTYCLPVLPSVWSEFKENLLDDFDTVWTPINGASIVSGKLHLVRANAQRVESSHSNKFHFANSDDVTIRLILSINSFFSDTRNILTTRIDEPFVSNWAIIARPGGGIGFSVWSGNGSGDAVNQTWDSAFNFDQEFEMSLERKNMVWKLYINGSQVGNSVTQIINYVVATQKFTLGSEFNAGNPDRNLDGEISMLQIIKGIALGGSGATTPRI